MTTIIKEIELVAMICGECGIVFGLESSYQKGLTKSAATFYCPNGHARWYGKSEADKLREEAQRLEQSNQYWRGVAETERAALRAERNALAARVAELEHIINDAENSVFLMTAAEWENLSPESRHKINVNINADRKRLERAGTRVERLGVALKEVLPLAYLGNANSGDITTSEIFMRIASIVEKVVLK